jgi:hypothetical protein
LPNSPAGFGWLDPGVLAVADQLDVAIGTPAHPALLLGGRITALTTDGHRLVAVVAGTRHTWIVAGTKAHSQQVLRLPPGTRVSGIAIG